MTDSNTANDKRGPGFLARLRRDTTGNTFAIVGAALVPLTALIGGGVDMSRGYMARERLQQACDAGALAGRRAMTNGTVDEAVITEAKKFFKFNFNTGQVGVDGTAAFGAKGFEPTVAASPTNATTVVVTAHSMIPTTVMGLFGYAALPLTVSCDAKQDFVNTDIMLVLDVTGSMACLPSDDAATCSNWVNANPSQVGVTTVRAELRMAALKEAVLALYDQLKPVQDRLHQPSVNMRMRYGIVPYSSGINVGAAVYAASPNYIESSWTYQSRVREPDGTWASTNTTNGTYTTFDSNWTGAGVNNTAWAQHSYTSTKMTEANCSARVPSPNPSAVTTTADNPAAATTNTDEDGVQTETFNQTQTSSRTQYRYQWGVSTTSGTTRDCRVDKRTQTQTQTRTNTKVSTPNYRWKYGPVTRDTSLYKAGNAVVTKTGRPTDATNENNGKGKATLVTSTWAGCIEERKTSSALTATSAAINDQAFDLNVDMVPSDAEAGSKWRPYWPEQEYYRTSTSSTTTGAKPQVACPAPAKRLQKWDDRTELSAYLNTLAPTGGTYHDNGMIWGARFISSGGIFGADNPTSYNGMPVTKHLIFMTDGYLDTGQTLYSTYGIEVWDNRVGAAGSDTDQDARHKQRFRLMCNRVKSMNVSVWVIAFASGLDTDLTNCASSSTQASTAANKATLIAKFTEIGKNIGALRLTQ
ncbi:Tad domain-containing protein [Sphingomonas sp. 1P06PA]|uniref:TadE/TadG family type IV pilus assembly protein n=1 Tax=Sphingomonas sp. 1P06PA TaxID=554121 RepID=UPI0039A59586